MLKNNYHTHTRYCGHAKGEVKDYVIKAISLGFNEIGISDHNAAPNTLIKEYGEEYSWCQSNMTLDDIKSYLKDIKEAKEEYKNKIKVLSSFECEYLSKCLSYYQILRSHVDYLNLGVHYFEYDNKILNSYKDINNETIYGYLNACINAMKTGLYNTLCHPDLFMYHYKAWDEHCDYVSHKICEAAIKYNVYLEINANGLRHNGHLNKSTWLYPNVNFWKIAKEYKDLKIIIGADAHDPELLDSDYIIKVEAFIKELGLNVLDKMEINH